MRRLCLLAPLLLTTCTQPATYPGNVVLGSFTFTADETADTCPFDNLPDGGVPLSTPAFTFEGVFSLEAASRVLYLTVNGTSRQGTLEGRHFRLEAEAARDVYCTDPVEMIEAIEGDLYAPGEMLGDGGCPNFVTAPTDGGDDTDAGFTDGGALDAGAADAGTLLDQLSDGGIIAPVLACGSLVDVTDGGCFASCNLSYQLIGVRQ